MPNIKETVCYVCKKIIIDEPIYDEEDRYCTCAIVDSTTTCTTIIESTTCTTIVEDGSVE